MRTIILVAMALALGAAGALAADKKGTRFWNLTSETQAEVSLAPAGTSVFGPNQCINDKDGTVETDEQLRITGVAPGIYDVRLRNIKGRICFARKVAVKADAIFSLQDKDLMDCTP